MKRNKKNNFLIIVDGLDLSGKTTLIQSLYKKYPGILVKITDRPLNDTEYEKGRNLGQFITMLKVIKHFNNIDTSVIFDRYTWTERVYSIKRNYDAINDIALDTIEDRIEKMNHLVVFCNPSIEVIKQRYKRRKEDHLKFTDIENLHKRFNEVYNISELNKISLDTNTPVNKLVEKVSKKLKQLKYI